MKSQLFVFLFNSTVSMFTVAEYRITMILKEGGAL